MSDDSSSVTTCQPGWLAVFHKVDGIGYTTEPVACWLHNTGEDEVHPLCALGGSVCNAAAVANYVGVIGPGSDVSDAKKLVEAYRESIKNKPTAA